MLDKFFNSNKKSGSNIVTKGVHVNKEYSEFDKTTYFKSTWSVDLLESDKWRNSWLTMQRVIPDGGKPINWLMLVLVGANGYDSARLKSVQFSADGNVVDLNYKPKSLAKISGGKTRTVGKKKATVHRSGKQECRLTDAELKTICDASSTNIRVTSGTGYIDVTDKQAKEAIKYLKCYYRECVDGDSYPEVAKVKPKRKIKIRWWHWLGGLILLSLISEIINS